MKVFNCHSVWASVLLFLPAFVLTLITLLVLAIGILLCLPVPLVMDAQVDLARKNTFRAQISMGWGWFAIILGAVPAQQIGFGHRDHPYLTFIKPTRIKRHRAHRSQWVLPIHQQEWRALGRKLLRLWKRVRQYSHYQESYLNVEFTTPIAGLPLGVNAIAYPLTLFLNRYRLYTAWHGAKAEKNQLHIDARIWFRVRILNLVLKLSRVS